MLRRIISRRSIIVTLFSSFPIAAWGQQSIFDQAQRLLGPTQGNTSAAGQASAPAGAKLNQNEIGLGLKDALKVAAQRVVGRVGKTDGYNGDPAIRIPLPDQLERVAGPLRSVGAGGMLDDLQLKMNRGAEQAAPKALNIFVDAASKMTFQDARMILTGPQDSATQYFRRTTSDSLTTAFRPIIDSALSSVGAVVALKSVQTRASGIPLIGQQVAGFNLTDFTVGKALDGCFHYLAVEESSIRTNPVARTTDLLKRVFG
jgi:Protein of unknown function (DUF4197)